jgi:hypothetical protein
LLWAYIVKVIPETRCVDSIWYLRFHYDKLTGSKTFFPHLISILTGSCVQCIMNLYWRYIFGTWLVFQCPVYYESLLTVHFRYMAGFSVSNVLWIFTDGTFSVHGWFFSAQCIMNLYWRYIFGTWLVFQCPVYYESLLTVHFRYMAGWRYIFGTWLVFHLLIVLCTLANSDYIQ